jgi:hypothetical protein
MKARIFYRIAAVLLVLFAAGHTIGFRQNNPEWGAEGIIGLMRSVHFDAQGFTRTYWDFFSAFGLFFSVFQDAGAPLEIHWSSDSYLDLPLGKIVPFSRLQRQDWEPQ